MKSTFNIKGITIATGLYLLLFLIWPLSYSEALLDTHTTPRLLLFCGFLIGLAVSVIAERKALGGLPTIKGVYPAYALAGWLVFSLIATAMSFSGFAIKISLLQQALLLLYFVLSYQLLKARHLDLLMLSRGIMVFTLILLAFGFKEIASQDSTMDALYLEGITGQMGNKNLLSSALMMCLPFLGIAAVRGLIYDRVIATILALPAIYMIYLLESRAIWLGIGLMALVAVAILLLRIKSSPKQKLIGGAGLLVLIVGGILVLVNHPRFEELKKNDTLHIRQVYWEGTAEMIAANPVTGVGAENWKIVFLKDGQKKFDPSIPYFEPIAKGEQIFQRPHNDFLWVFAEAGIPGGLCYLALFGMMFFFLIRLLRNPTSNKEALTDGLLLAFLLGYIADASFSLPLERPTHQLLFYTVCAIITARYYTQFEQTNSRMNKPWLPILVIVVAGVSAYWLNGHLEGEKHLKLGIEARTGRQAAEASGGDKAIFTAYNTNARTYFSKAKEQGIIFDHTTVALDWYIAESWVMEGNINAALPHYLEAEKAHPYNAYNLANIAVLNYQLGNKSAALKYFNKSLEVSPTFMEGRINLSIYYLQENDFDMAMLTFLKGWPDAKLNKYIPLMRQLFNHKIDQLIKETTDAELKQQLAYLKTQPEALIELHKKAFKNPDGLKALTINTAQGLSE